MPFFRKTRRKKIKNPIYLILFLVITAFINSIFKEDELQDFQDLKIKNSSYVQRVIDGDTLKLSSGERVRLIGVDTPETRDPRLPVQYFGKEAAKFTRALAEGRKVRLEYDIRRKDRYNRTLAYVFLQDGTFLNAEIIKQGYGFAYTRFPFKYLDEFRRLEKEARENRRGLWR